MDEAARTVDTGKTPRSADPDTDGRDSAADTSSEASAGSSDTEDAESRPSAVVSLVKQRTDSAGAESSEEESPEEESEDASEDEDGPEDVAKPEDADEPEDESSDEPAEGSAGEESDGGEPEHEPSEGDASEDDGSGEAATKVEAKVEAKTDAKVEAKAKPDAEVKAAAVKTDVKPEAKTEPKTEPKTEAKPKEPVDDVQDETDEEAEESDESDESRRRRRLPAWLELPLLLAFGLVVVLVLHSYVAQPFVIPSGSMENTLEIGDRVLVNKLAYTFGDRPERGDIVVFDGTGVFTPEGEGGDSSNLFGQAVDGLVSMFGFGNSDETDFVKRVIGIGGDHVVCCDAQGRITVNGVALEESGYLYPGDAPSTVRFDVVVPAGELWVMGDHRANSADSREHMGRPGGGFVPEDRVVGRVDWIIWPVSRMGGVNRPSTFSQPGIDRQDHPVVPNRG